jgi:hypothetical protein
MPKKSKATKKKAAGRKTRKAKRAKPSAASGLLLKAIKVHPHLADAILSLKKLGPEEFQEIKSLSGAATTEGLQSTGCWISDSGGQQHCVNLPPDVCTRKGGISVPTRCPNT